MSLLARLLPLHLSTQGSSGSGDLDPSPPLSYRAPASGAGSLGHKDQVPLMAGSSGSQLDPNAGPNVCLQGGTATEKNAFHLGRGLDPSPQSPGV